MAIFRDLVQLPKITDLDLPRSYLVYTGRDHHGLGPIFEQRLGLRSHNFGSGNSLQKCDKKVKVGEMCFFFK